MKGLEDIQELASEAVLMLKGMIRIPSPSFDEDKVCAYICEWMKEKGVEHKRSGNNIIAENIINADFPTLMLCAHIDTVSPSPEYGFDPYEPDYEKAAEVIGRILEKDVDQEEVVAGLGSNDDGASVVAMTAAFRHFLSDPDLKLNLRLVLSCEEERSGKGGMTGLWPELKESTTMAIIGEPTGMKAATSERGLLVIDGTAQGVSGHAARNEGINALYMALDDIYRLRNHDFQKISPRMGKVNLNVTQISGGSAHNVIPDICTFVVDIRPTEKYSNEEILSELQALCSSSLKARNLGNRSSATAELSPLQKTAERLDIETFSSPTTSDWMRIDCDAIKMGPGESSRSHRKDEFVLISEIENGISTYIRFINELAK